MGYFGVDGSALSEVQHLAPPAESCWCQQATVEALPVLGAVLAALLLLDRWSRGRARRLAEDKTHPILEHGEIR